MYFSKIFIFVTISAKSVIISRFWDYLIYTSVPAALVCYDCSMKNILNNKYIIPLFMFTIGLVGYLLNILTTLSSVMTVIGVLGLMANCNEWSKPDPKTVNIIVLSSLIACVNPFLSLIYIFCAFYVLGCALASRPLTAEERMLQEQQRMYYETRRHNEEMEQLAREQELSKPRLNWYGRPLDQILPQSAKMLQIHVKYHNGTSGMWQKIGIEHEVRAMLENDPRIENFDIGLLSPSDNGRYPEY